MNSFETYLSCALGQPQAGKIFLAAVSGGADSTAMLTALAALRKEAGFFLHCVHVEHGLRPAEESQGDARAVEALCEKLDVPCLVIAIPEGKIAAYASKKGSGIEGAARFFRHRAWNQERRRIGAEKILTGHTKDDLLETILMRILRGSGPAGLAPMPQSRGRLLRPLLEVTRQDVLKYLEEKGISYRTDATNQDICFFRNRIRHKLIPLLDDFFPSWQSSLIALAETQALTAEFLASETAKRLPWQSEADQHAFGNALRLQEEDFFKAPPILREEAIFSGVDMLADLCSKSGNKLPRRSAVRRVGDSHFIAQDLGPVRLERRNGFLTLTRKVKSPCERGFSLLIKEPGSFTLKGKTLGMKKDLFISAELLPDKENPPPRESVSLEVSSGHSSGKVFAYFPLVFRNHRKGDCILKGGHKRRFSDIIDKSSLEQYSGIITVCDPFGLAAFITFGSSLKVISRDSAGDLHGVNSYKGLCKG